MSTKIIGFESANSFVKVFNGSKTNVYPNTVSVANMENYSIGDNRDINTVYEINGHKFTVGNTAKYISSSMESTKRYSSEYYYNESIIAISHAVKNGDHVIAATGIPSNHYKDKESVARMIKKNLKGTHTIKVNGQELEFTIKDVLITLQPLASFFYCAIDEHGNPDEGMMERFTDSETLVIDIGWGTTDLAVCFGSGLREHFNIDTTMKTAYRMILERLKDQARKDGRNLATANIKLLDLEKHLRKSNIYQYGNEQYDCTLIKKEVFSQITNNILTEVNGVIGEIEPYRTVVISGGGAAALLLDLEERLTSPRTGKLEENIFIMSDNQVSNVKGYYVFGKYLQD